MLGREKYACEAALQGSHGWGNIFSSVHMVLLSQGSSLTVHSCKKHIFCLPGRRQSRNKATACFKPRVVREAEVTKDASRNCIVKAPSPGVMRLCKTFMVSWFILLTRFLIMVEKTSWKGEQKAVKHKASKGNFRVHWLVGFQLCDLGKGVGNSGVLLLSHSESFL